MFTCGSVYRKRAIRYHSVFLCREGASSSSAGAAYHHVRDVCAAHQRLAPCVHLSLSSWYHVQSRWHDRPAPSLAGVRPAHVSGRRLRSHLAASAWIWSCRRLSAASRTYELGAFGCPRSFVCARGRFLQFGFYGSRSPPRACVRVSAQRTSFRKFTAVDSSLRQGLQSFALCCTALEPSHICGIGPSKRSCGFRIRSQCTFRSLVAFVLTKPRQPEASTTPSLPWYMQDSTQHDKFRFAFVYTLEECSLLVRGCL